MKAIRNLLRMPAKSVVLLSVYFVLSLLLIFMFVLHSIATANIGKAVGPLGSCVEVSSSSGDVRLTIEQAEKIAGGFGIIETYHAQTETLCDVPGIVNFKTKADGDTTETDRFDPFTLIAVTSTDTVREFYSGRRTITAGKGILREANDNGTLMIVISQSLAELNNLTLGDPVGLRIKTVYSPTAAERTVYIGGIFSDTVAMVNSAAYSYQLPKNEIYIPMSVYRHITASVRDEISLKKLYFEMNSISDKAVSALETRLHNIGYSTAKDLRLSAFSPETEAAAMSKLSKSLDIAITAVIICFAVALLGILLWNIQSRTREIGIYCALGIKRHRISFMLARETLTLFVVAFVTTSVILTFVSSLYGAQLYSDFSSGISGTQYETSVETLLQTEAVQSYTENMFSDNVFILTEYLLPASAKTLSCFLVLLLLAYAVSQRLISRLEVMKVMGGGAS